MAQYRQVVSTGGYAEDDEGCTWDGFAMAMKDPFTYLFSAIHFFVIMSQSFKDFFPTVSHRHRTSLEDFMLTQGRYKDCGNT
jgi:hypothetical protein